MQKYGFVHDDGCCTVSDIDSVELAEALGLSLIDVEQASDGFWHLTSEHYQPDQKTAMQARMNDLQDYLSSTDWYAARLAETGVEIPEEIRSQRQSARDEISRLREELMQNDS